MKNREILFCLLIIVLPNLAFAESGCRYESRFETGCIGIWFLGALFSGIPVAIGILLIGWVWKKLKVLVFRRSIWILNFGSISTMISVGMIQSCSLSGLAIYGNSGEGEWNSFRDFTLVPLGFVVIVYVPVFFLLRYAEKKWIRKNQQSRLNYPICPANGGNK